MYSIQYYNNNLISDTTVHLEPETANRLLTSLSIICRQRRKSHPTSLGRVDYVENSSRYWLSKPRLPLKISSFKLSKFLTLVSQPQFRTHIPPHRTKSVPHPVVWIESIIFYTEWTRVRNHICVCNILFQLYRFILSIQYWITSTLFASCNIWTRPH